jgi:aryl-alcohol dehydrogenase-like predicted oxidoreductase
LLPTILLARLVSRGNSLQTDNLPKRLNFYRIDLQWIGFFMQRRALGNTGVDLPVLSYGASSIGQEFRKVDLSEALRSVQVALDLGMDFIDTAAYYGRGMSECLLGVVLRDIPRDRYLLGSKLGRYAPAHFDFSAKRVIESVDISLMRMGVEYLDFMICHDIEFVDIDQVIEETLPALRKIKDSGKVRFIGISGYPMKIFSRVLERTSLDFILSYNHYTLQNTMLSDMVPYLKSKNVGIMNAAPFAARLLTNTTLPVWHKATPEVRAICKRAAEHCAAQGYDIAQLALQYSIAHPDLATCIVGSANPENVKKWVAWAEAAVPDVLMQEVLGILKPIHNWFHIEGRPENNDSPTVQ